MATGGQGAPTTSKPPPRPNKPTRKPAVPVSGDHAPQTPVAPLAPAPAPSAPVEPPAPGSPQAQSSPIGLPQFTGKPNPILTSLGYFGAVQDLERRIGIVRSAYQQKFQTDPTPGIAFDVARSDFQDQHLATLIDGTPGSMAQARSQTATSQALVDHPYDFFRTRPDGLLVQNNALLDKINQVVQTDPLTIHEMYPTVQAGIIPIAGFGSVMDAIKTVDSSAKAGALDVTDHGLTLKQFQHQQQLAGQQLEPGSSEAQAFAKGQTAMQAVTTVKEAQKQLNVMMDTTLPVTGFFNQTWAKALGDWMKTTSYFSHVVKFQTQQAGFGTDTGSYVKAWKAKQDAVRKHALGGWFFNALPLPLFGHSLTGEPGAIFDYLRGPGYSWKSLDFYTTTPLHSLTRTATLSADTLGGSLQQAKAISAAATQFADSFSPKALGGRGMTIDEAKKRAAHELRENPSWLRIAHPDLPEHETGILAAIDQVTNVAADLVLLRKPEFTGERVASGDVTLASRSPHLAAVGTDAYKLIRNGMLGRAVSRLEGGHGAEGLAAAAEGPIQSGAMSLDTFMAHLHELYANKYTVIRHDTKASLVESPLAGVAPAAEEIAAAAEKAVTTGQKAIPAGPGTALERRTKGEVAVPQEGPIYATPVKVESTPVIVHGSVAKSLMTSALPTPGLPGSVWKDVRSAMRSTADEMNSGLANSRFAPANMAGGFMSNVRLAFSHVVGTTGGYFDPTLPERVFNATLKATGDPKVANEMEAALIRARAVEDIPGIQQVNRQLEKLYSLKYPEGRPSSVQDPFEPQLETEAPSVFRFPTGGHQAIDSRLRYLQVAASQLNTGFNKIAKVQARLILATPGMGMVLGWKHLFGDTMRRFIGGGIELRRMNDAKRVIGQMAEEDPSVERMLGAARERTQLGEQAWLLDRRSAERESFTTGEKMDTGWKRNRKAYMAAAGGYVRRLVTDRAVQAYQMGSATDLSPLVHLVETDRTYRALWQEARAAGDGTMTAEEYAGLLHQRFKEFEDAAANAGVSDPFDAAREVLSSHRGAKADRALGNWISANKIDMPIRKGLVTKGANPFDDISTAYLQQIMRPNKWNRAHFYDNILHKTFGELTAAGVKEEHALGVASELAEAQTKFHMLDFSNRMQIEQNLRWISYFATKHRLYWKWVIGTMVRRPGTALAVADAKNSLDSKGNLNFHLPFNIPGVGQKFSIPATRLFWIPGKEYSETSPIIQFGKGALSNGGFDFAAGWKAANGTNGNVFTRSDTALRIAAKLGFMYAGKTPTTYGAAVAGLPPNEQRYMNRAMNEYQTTYFHSHGHYASESAVVKHVLWHSMAQEYWSTNLPLPVVTSHDATAEQKLVGEFMALDDPRARSKFLQAHPGVADHFGVYTNPNVYLHNRDMFARYASMLNNYHHARQSIYEQALTGGMTGPLALQKRTIDAAFQKQFLQLQREDAMWRSADGDKTVKYGTPGAKPTDAPKVPGPWGRLVQADPQLDPYSKLNALFPGLHNQQANVIGQLQTDLQKELDLLNNPDYANTYPDPAEIKTRRSEILAQLDVFRGYPTDALGKVQLAYEQNHVQPYWTASDKRWQAIQKLPRTAQVVAYAKYRAWRDAQDKPVVVNGVHFPSPVRMAWATLDPATKQQRLAKLAAYNWQSLTSYEKNLLGFKGPTKEVSDGYMYMEEFIADAQKALPAGQRLPKGYRDYYAKYVGQHVPGFYADYKLSRQPSYQRLSKMTVVQQSPFYKSEQHGASWQDLLASAKAYHDAYAGNKSYSRGAVTDTWKRYVDSSLLPWIAQTPGFQKELLAYGTTDFLYGLVNP